MIYKANDKFSASLSSGYTVGQTTLYTSAVPDNVPTIIVAAKGTDNETVFSVTGKTTNSLTGVTRLRGANVNLDAQTPITCLNNEEFINQYETALFAAEGLKTMIAGVDGGSNDSYAISLDPAPTDYDNLIGVPIVFKANTANTGAASLNLNGLGDITIKKNKDQDLSNNDIKAGQLVIVAYDGTYFQQLGGGAPPVHRAFTWFLPGTEVVRDEAGARFIVPQAMTVVAIKHKTASGTATIRLQKGTTDIKASISVTSSVATETSITSAALSANDVLTLDLTAVSSPVDLTVTLECTEP